MRKCLVLARSHYDLLVATFLVISFIGLLTSAAISMAAIASFWYLMSALCWGAAGLILGHTLYSTTGALRLRDIACISLAWSTVGLAWGIWGPLLTAPKLESLPKMDVTGWLIRGAIAWSFLGLGTCAVVRVSKSPRQWLWTCLDAVGHAMAATLALGILLVFLNTVDYSVIGFCTMAIGRYLSGPSNDALMIAAVISGLVGTAAGAGAGGVVSSGIARRRVQRDFEERRELRSLFWLSLIWGAVWILGIFGYVFASIPGSGGLLLDSYGEEYGSVLYIIFWALGGTLLLGLGGWITSKMILNLNPSITADAVKRITLSWLGIGACMGVLLVMAAPFDNAINWACSPKFPFPFFAIFAASLCWTAGWLLTSHILQNDSSSPGSKRTRLLAICIWFISAILAVNAIYAFTGFGFWFGVFSLPIIIIGLVTIGGICSFISATVLLNEQRLAKPSRSISTGRLVDLVRWGGGAGLLWGFAETIGFAFPAYEPLMFGLVFGISWLGVASVLRQEYSTISRQAIILLAAVWALVGIAIESTLTNYFGVLAEYLGYLGTGILIWGTGFSAGGLISGYGLRWVAPSVIHWKSVSIVTAAFAASGIIGIVISSPGWLGYLTFLSQSVIIGGFSGGFAGGAFAGILGASLAWTYTDRNEKSLIAR